MIKTPLFPDSRWPLLDIPSACNLLQSGGILVYPTETFYAIGCLYDNENAIRLIYKLKQRPLVKPIPLIAASMPQISAIADTSSLSADKLATAWPGPLTILFPAKAGISPLLVNREGKLAIRISSHKLCRTLVQTCGIPLTASSANISGRPPSLRASAIDHCLLDNLLQDGIDFGLVFGEEKSTPNQEPSTIIEPVDNGGQNIVQILRHGAVSDKQLEKIGFVAL